MATEQKDFIVAIELGSSKVTGIAGQKKPDGSISVLAMVREDSSSFIRKGVVYNIDKTAQCLTSIVKKLESLLSERAVYLGMPTCGFKVGEYTVSKTGEITGGELSDEIKSSLARAGFVPVSETDESETAPEDKPKGLTFTIPLSELNGKAENFVNMVESKGELIKAAFGIDELPVNRTEDELQILWFKDKEPDNPQVAEKFVRAMVEKARAQKYVSPKPLETDNAKYSMRVFLNSIGFIGTDHKAIRTELLKNLSGSSAWRHPETRRTAK